MRIAYVGNFTRPWCTEVHVAASLEALGHHVERMQENLVDWARLPGRISDAEAEALLWTRTWHVDPTVAGAALGRLRDAGVPTASFHLDRFLGLEREPLVDSEPFFRTDVLFTPDSDLDGWAAHGVRAVWCPPGVYHAEAEQTYQPAPERWPYDVVMVGSYPYPHPDWAPYRAEAVKRLRKRFQRRFAVIPAELAPNRRNRPVRGAQLGELYATVPVVVGDSCLSGNPTPTRYWSDRVPETLGRGGCLIHPEVDGLADWYGHGDHLLTYPLGDFDSMVNWVEQLLDKPEWRQMIARKGRELVLARDTYVARMQVVVAYLEAALEAGGITDWLPELAPDGTNGRPLGRTLHRDVAGSVTPSGELRHQLGNVTAGDGLEASGTFAVLNAEPADDPLADAERCTVRFAGRRQLQATFTVVGGDSARHALAEVWTHDNYQAGTLGLSGATVVDVGANLGAFSVLAAKLGARQVHAYEPHPLTFRALEANVAASGVPGRIVCHQAALGTGSRAHDLAGDGGAAHLVGDDELGPALTVGGDLIGGHRVEVLDFSEALERILLDAGAPDLVVKMDCEGAERELIGGLDPDLFASIRAIAMEFHGPRMPHLTHLDVAGFGTLVVKLAEYGNLRIHGRPEWGGLLWWERRG